MVNDGPLSMVSLSRIVPRTAGGAASHRGVAFGSGGKGEKTNVLLGTSTMLVLATLPPCHLATLPSGRLAVYSSIIPIVPPPSTSSPR